MATSEQPVLQANSRPKTPPSAISDVFESREALDQEARSRQATEEICRERHGRTNRPSIPHKAPKGPKAWKEPKYRKKRPAPLKAFDGYSAPVPNFAMAPEQVHYNPYPLPLGERSQQPVMYAPHAFPSGGFYVNGPPANFLPPQIQQQVVTMVPCLDSAAHQYLLRPDDHSTKPGHITRKQIKDEILENEFDRSRGAFFGRQPAHPTFPEEGIQIKAPNTGIAVLQRNDITSLKAEVVAENSGTPASGTSKAMNSPEQEQKETVASDSGMEERLRKVEQRLEEVNEKLDQVLAALGRA